MYSGMQNNTQDHKLSQDKRQALEMIRNSSYFKSINRVTMLHAKMLNCLAESNLNEASQIVDQMVSFIVNSK